MFLMLMWAVGKVLLTLTLVCPGFGELRTTTMARPFHVFTRAEV
jgi:hypothetical protein